MLQLGRDGNFREIYNGPGAPVWHLVRVKPIPKSGQYQVRLSTLERVMKEIPDSERLVQKRNLHAEGTAPNTLLLDGKAT